MLNHGTPSLLWANIPDIVRSIVCLDFLSLPDIAALDNACSSSRARAALQHCLIHPSFGVLVTNQVKYIHEEAMACFIDWVYHRRCAVQALSITISPPDILRLNHAYPFIRSVSVSSNKAYYANKCDQLARNCVVKLLQACPNIAKLEFHFDDATEAVECIYGIVHAPDYICLTDFSADTSNDEAVSDDVILPLLQRFHDSLESFKLNRYSPAAFEYLCTHCKRIKKLHVDISGLMDKGDFIRCISLCGASIDVLRVERLPPAIAIVDEDMLEIAMCLPNLRELVLLHAQSFYDVTISSLMHFLTHCSSLSQFNFLDEIKLNVSDTSKLEKGDSTALLPIKQVQKQNSFNSLTLNMDLRECTEAAMCDIMELLPDIHVLHIDADCLVQPTVLCAAIVRSKHRLTLESLRLSIACVLKSSENMFIILQSSPGLTHLVIDNSMRFVPQSLLGRRQKKDLIKNISQSCHGVERFCFYPGCRSMSLADLVCKLVDGMPMLKRLYLRGDYLEDDMGLRNVAPAVQMHLRDRKVDVELVSIQAADFFHDTIVAHVCYE